MSNGVDDIATAHAVAMAMEIDLQFDKAKGEKSASLRPVLYMVAVQRGRAITAMNGLVNAAPDDSKSIREFQNEIKLYDDMIAAARKVYDHGREEDRKIAEEDRTTIYDLIRENWATAEGLGVTGVNDQ